MFLLATAFIQIRLSDGIAGVSKSGIFTGYSNLIILSRTCQPLAIYDNVL